MGLLGGLAGEPRGDLVQFGDVADGVVVALGDPVRRERVRLDDVGTRQEVAQVDVAHGVGLRERQQLVVAGEVAGVVTEAVTPERVVGQAERLDLGAHRSVEHDDAIAGERGESGGSVRSVRCSWLLSSCDLLDGTAVVAPARR